MLPKPQKSNVCAIVVTYFPDSELSQRLLRVTSQAAATVVVDNASDPSIVKLLDDLQASGAISLIANSENLGVATALNQGLAWARDHGFAWVLTLDQDSVVNDDAVSVFEKVFEASRHCCRPAIIGSNFVDRLTGVPLVPDSAFEGREWTDILTVITSGTLVSVEAARLIGPFRDDFFIDYLDAEYCLRAQRCGFNVIITKAALMEHTVGYPRWHRFLWKRLITPHLSPERRYYMSRNFVVLAREYFGTHKAWVSWLMRVRMKETILIVLFERQKMRKLAYTFLGIIDAFRGRMGRM